MTEWLYMMLKKCQNFGFLFLALGSTGFSNHHYDSHISICRRPMPQIHEECLYTGKTDDGFHQSRI